MLTRLTDWLVVQKKHVFVFEVLSLLSAALLAFGVAHSGAADTEDSHRRHPRHLGHFHNDPPGHFVSATIKRFARIVEDNLERFHTLRHSHHDCLGIN